jgi:3-methyl-2-oxobutanoate hydroxymethyltransferase
MSTGSDSRLIVPEIRARERSEKLVCSTAYAAPMAKLLDPLVDILLVEDTVA